MMRYRMFWAVAVLAFCGLSGAQAQDMPRSALKFSHRQHIEDAELECATCHDVEASISSSDRLLPSKEVCGECHDVEDDENCATCHVDIDLAGEIARSAAPVLFSHKTHVKNGDEDCATCHATAAQATRSTDRLLPDMATCSTCHDNATAPMACATCHLDVTHLKPESHFLNWRQTHGQRVRTGDKACATCHPPSECQECHEGAHLTVTNPLNSQASFVPQTGGEPGLVLQKVHELNYRFTHALDAKGKMQDCAKCHEQDAFCSDCHQTDSPLTKPAWHGGPDWGAIAGAVGTGGGRHARLARRDMERCAACHSAVGDDPTCILCHMDRTPGLGNDPKTHGSRFKSQIGEGDFHDNPNSMCYNCHTRSSTSGVGFCGYCHGPER